MKEFSRAAALAVLPGLSAIAPVARAEQGDSTSFKMVRSAGAAVCLSTKARGTVTIGDTGQVQNRHVEAFGLPAKTQFTVFLLQIPHSPFGFSWYQGDILTDKGHGVGDFSGIFGIETFIHAPGVASAPKIFPDDAISNPATPPVQLYPMGGDHQAGIQVLSTRNFEDDEGPLLALQ
jgi:hypothetical protein